jgi:hypothetical protein
MWCGSHIASPPVEGTAMRFAGWSFQGSEARVLALPAIAIAGCAAWLMLPEPSDAEGQSPPQLSQVHFAQNVSLIDLAAVPAEMAPAQSDATAPTEVTTPDGAAPPPETMVGAKPTIDGLRISSQSWRRGGLGSKALVTLTLRNTNDYAVKDIEIACAFARRDGSHLTDRRRVLPDIVNMRSRKTYSGMLIGFVNVNANKAKCTPVAANRT